MAYHPNAVPLYLWIQLSGEGLRSALPLALVLVVLALSARGPVKKCGNEVRAAFLKRPA